MYYVAGLLVVLSACLRSRPTPARQHRQNDVCLWRHLLPASDLRAGRAPGSPRCGQPSSASGTSHQRRRGSGGFSFHFQRRIDSGSGEFGPLPFSLAAIAGRLGHPILAGFSPAKCRQRPDISRKTCYNAPNQTSRKDIDPMGFKEPTFADRQAAARDARKTFSKNSRPTRDQTILLCCRKRGAAGASRSPGRGAETA